jgi:hypothetical protein
VDRTFPNPIGGTFNVQDISGVASVPDLQVIGYHIVRYVSIFFIFSILISEAGVRLYKPDFKPEQFIIVVVVIVVVVIIII